MELVNRSDCRGYHMCGNWRICERCAKFRAAKIADRAEYLEQKFGRLALARVSPEENSELAIRKLRDSIVRAKLAPAGIWTIETGELYAGLHLNCIFPASYQFEASKRFDYVELIKTSSRAAAAYIAKRKGMPQMQQYGGRLTGSWGTFMQKLMSSKDQAAAACQAAAVNMALGLTKPAESAWVYFSPQSKQLTREPAPYVEKTRDEYREIARKHLSNLYAIMPELCSNKTTVKT